MATAGTQFSRLTQYLLDNPTIADDDYIDLDVVFSAVTPPPSASLKIGMNEDFDAQKFIDAIIYALRGRSAAGNATLLTRRTWKRMFRFFDPSSSSSSGGSSFDHSQQQRTGDRTSQLKFEALLTFSKIDQKEFFAFRPNGDIRFTCARAYFNEKMADLLEEFVGGNVEMAPIGAIYADGVVSAVKNFLLNRPIMAAFVWCLRDVFGRDCCMEEVEMKKQIMKMNIYVVPSMGRFGGLSVRDGVVLFDRAALGLISGAFSGGGGGGGDCFPIESARTFTILLHETIHHLARVIEGDYNFSTPTGGRFKIDSPPPPPRMDPVLKNGKTLELGRHLELVLFDDIQPDWDGAEAAGAARLFLHRARLDNDRLPLIKKQEHVGIKLRDRSAPSISFGPEFIYWDDQPKGRSFNDEFYLG